MSYSQDLKTEKPRFMDAVISSGSTGAIDLKGGTLVGVKFDADLTSTSFTINVSDSEEGTYTPLKDTETGAVITFTVGSDSVGFFTISKDLTYGFRFCDLIFNSSDTGAVLKVATRNL